jgi:prefoldin subunit 5
MKSLNSIFKNFQKTLNQLDEYITQTNERLDKNEAKMVEIQAENSTYSSERNKAVTARVKIADLMGEGELGKEVL